MQSKVVVAERTLSHSSWAARAAMKTRYDAIDSMVLGRTSVGLDIDRGRSSLASGWAARHPFSCNVVAGPRP